METLNLTREDLAVAKAWDYTPREWAALTDSERVNLRANVALATNLASV